MNIIIHALERIKFGNLDYGTVFQYRDVKYLKILDPTDGDVAIVLDDPFERTSGTYIVNQIGMETLVDKIYSADLTLYE